MIACGINLDEKHGLYCGDGKNNCFSCIKKKEGIKEERERILKIIENKRIELKEVLYSIPNELKNMESNKTNQCLRLHASLSTLKGIKDTLDKENTQ